MGTAKKIRFFIFEGSTDIVSLGGYLEKLFNSNFCRVKAWSAHGDITSDWKTTSENLTERVREIVDDYRMRAKLSYSDFLEIVQVVDTDGAYVSEDRILTGNYDHPFIDVGKGVIRTIDRLGIADRNLGKTELIDLLVECEEIEGIPYRVMFMSSNLEHVLHGRANCNDQDEKTKLSKKFALRFDSDLPGFVRFISESDFAVKGGYRESWDYIRNSEKDTRSLERHTNIGLLFDDCALSD